MDLPQSTIFRRGISQILHPAGRVIQEKTYEPLGGTKTENADIRIVVATNKNLEELVQIGKFREDLYYRINVVKLLLPPLRNRKEDIPLLCNHFIQKFNRLNNKNIQGLRSDVLSVLMSHEYPGNVRELENIFEYACVVCKNNLIGTEHLPEYLYGDKHLDSGINYPEPDEQMHLRDLERDFIYNSLMKNNWNRKETAANLGIHPTTLWRKIKHLGIEIPKQDGRSKNI